MTVDANQTSISVSWDQPKINTENITGFLIFYHEKSHKANNYEIVGSSSAVSTEVHGLKAGTAYLLRVCAFNQNGNGIPSELVEFTTKEEG